MPIDTLQTPSYTVEGDAFVRHNGERYCNRPLYCNHIYALALGGDKPFCVLGNDKTTQGGLMFALVRDGKGIWLQNASDVTSKYRPGRMEWIVKDAAWGATTVHLEEVPTAHGPGLAARVTVEGAQPGDRLIWGNGAAFIATQSVPWQYDMISQGKIVDRPRRSIRRIAPETRSRSPADRGRFIQRRRRRAAQWADCSVGTEAIAADADAWANPVALLTTTGQSRPMACGSVPLVSGQADLLDLARAGRGRRPDAGQGSLPPAWRGRSRSSTGWKSIRPTRG